MPGLPVGHGILPVILLLTGVLLRLAHGQLTGISAASLRSFHVHGCDGEHVTLRCPHGTTISIQRAMYGRQLSSLEMCPSYALSATLSAAEAARAAAQRLPIKENTNCDSPTSLQKMLDECQNKRHCQVQVHTQVFGVDPCPGTSKYLEVKYKCKPSQYKGRVACDGDTLRLRCKKNHRLAIYTAMYGRGQDGSLECPSNIPQPHKECRSPSALQRIIQQCQGKPRCVLEADSGEYGDPCPRGTRKYISVIHTCVPRQVLVDISWLTFPLSGDHSFVGDSGFPPGQPSYIPSPSTKKYDLIGGEEGVVVVPVGDQDGKQSEKPQVREVLKDNPVIVEVPYGGIMEEATVTLSPYIPATAPDGIGGGQPAKLRVFSDILATYGYIRDNPEKALLYFILGICSGILLLLFGLIFKLTCFSGQDRQQKESSQEFSSQEEENSEEVEHEHDHRTDRRPEAIEVVRWNGRDYTRHNHTLNHSHPGMHHELDEPPGTRSLNRYYP
ncbi:protein eva-1 homolog C-like [Branchiostoma floridae x Branchiostoma japonicum]